MKENNYFKVCPNCDFVWKNRDDFIGDDTVSIIGYQVNFKTLSSGLFLFNHSCMGTFSLKVGAFKDLYTGPIFQERATGSDDCPEYCLHKDKLEPCPATCECAFAREIIQILKK